MTACEVTCCFVVVDYLLFGCVLAKFFFERGRYVQDHLTVSGPVAHRFIVTLNPVCKSAGRECKERPTDLTPIAFQP